MEQPDCAMKKKKVHSEEFFIPNITRVIKSRKSKWVENVAQIADVRNLHKIFMWKS
jgi:hypothetical protein